MPEGPEAQAAGEEAGLELGFEVASLEKSRHSPSLFVASFYVLYLLWLFI